MNYRLLLPISVLILVLMMVSFFFIVDSIAVHFSQLEKSEQVNLAEYNHLYEQKEILLKENDVIQLDWLRTLNPLVKNVTGEVIWSTNKQSGFLVISGLPKPTLEESYKLWIYDLEKHLSKPVSTSLEHNRFALKHANDQALIIPFKPHQYLDIPYKFELILERTMTDVSKKKDMTKLSPLLLAQP